jgi:hypothetical protein
MALFTVRVLSDVAGETGRRPLACASEGEAVLEMLDLAGEDAAELWCDERMILWWPGRVTPPSRSAHEPRAQRPTPLFSEGPRCCLGAG